MARIQHIAVHAHDTDALADFYIKTFGMEEVSRLPAQDGRWRHFLSDGHINLAILPGRLDAPEGINHFGFQVDDVDTASEAAVKGGAKVNAERVPQDGRGNEAFIKDPIGQRVDLSAKGWPLTRD